MTDTLEQKSQAAIDLLQEFHEAAVAEHASISRRINAWVEEDAGEREFNRLVSAFRHDRKMSRDEAVEAVYDLAVARKQSLDAPKPKAA